MSDAEAKCEYLVDCYGLSAIASISSDNAKAVLLALLANGTIGVTTNSWNEFEELYPQEAAVIKPHIKLKIKMSPRYHQGAASMADKLNSSLTIRPYDNYDELYICVISELEGYIILTAHRNKKKYEKMNGGAIEVSELIENL